MACHFDWGGALGVTLMARRKFKTSIALDPDLVRRLDRVSRASRRSRSELITDLVQDGLGQEEVMVKAASDPVLMAAVGKALAAPGVLRNMVGGLRSELSDGQLDLFRSRLDSMTSEAMRQVVSESVGTKKVRKKRGKL